MHSCVYVLINGKKQNTESLVNQALAPFDEELAVPPYKEHLSRSGIRLMAEHYKISETDLKQLASKMQDWMGRPGGIDELGLFAVSTCNPHGKWDWYEIGGRWDGYLTGRTPPPTESASRLIDANSTRASTLLKDPKLSSRLPAAVVTPTGEWIEKDAFITTSSGWFIAERTKRDWMLALRRIVAAFPTHTVVCVDVHK